MTFVRNTIVTLTSGIGMNLVGLLTGMLLARTLGPSGRGLMTTVLLWPQILTWAVGLSYGWGIIYYGASLQDAQRRIFGNSLIAAAALGVLGAAGSIWLVPRLIPLTPLEHTLIIVGLLMLPLSIWTDFLQSQIQSANQFGQLGMTRVCGPVCVAAALLLFWWAGRLTAETAVIATWAGSWVTTLVSLALIWKDGFVKLEIDSALSRACLAYGAKMHLGTLAGVANARVDQLIMTAMVPVRVIGLYAFAVTLSEMLNQVSTSISIVLLPKASSATAEERLDIVQRVSRFTILIGAFIGIFLYAAAPVLVRLIWGERFIGSIPAIRILIPGTIALGLAKTLSTGLRGAGKPTVGTYSEIVSLAVMVPLLFAWIPKFSLIGAAWASTIGYCINLVVVAAMFGREFTGHSLTKMLPKFSDFADARRIAARLSNRKLRPAAPEAVAAVE